MRRLTTTSFLALSLACSSTFNRGISSVSAFSTFTFRPPSLFTINHRGGLDRSFPLIPVLLPSQFYSEFHTSTSTSLAARGRGGRKVGGKSSGNTATMRGVKKENLPSKICVTCNRPFTWRKKWERVWDEVTTCSKSCNRKRREKMRQSNKAMSTSTFDDEDCDVNGSVGSASKEESRALTYDTAPIKSMGDQLHLIGADLEECMRISQHEDSSTNDANQYDEHDDGSNSIDSTTNEQQQEEVPTLMDANARRKAERKAAKKARKAARRAEREGRGDPTAGQKDCDIYV